MDWDNVASDEEVDPRIIRKMQRRKLKGKGKMSLVQRQSESIKQQKTARMKRQKEEEAVLQSSAPKAVDETDITSGSSSDDSDGQIVP